ncbi:MAG TPA: transcription-repair coupling factor [Gammaproteobacteria bacterium]
MKNIQLFNLRTSAWPYKGGEPVHWGQLYGGAYALAIKEACERHSGPVLLVAESVQHASRLELELGFFFKHSGYELLTLPDWETLPYDHFSPHQDIVSQRLLTLYRLPSLKRGALIVPAMTLMQRLVPAEYIGQNVLLLTKGEKLDLEAFRERLAAGGYQHVSQVMEHGEFTIRGSIIDLYPMGSPEPYRIDLFDDEIESIRSFDPGDQRSQTQHDNIRLLPAREYPLTPEGIKHFRSAYRNRFEGNPQNNPVYRDISDGIAAPGSEYYLPLFFETTQTLFDYLPADTLLLQEAGAADALEQFWRDVQARYEQLRYDIERPLLEPAELYLTPETAITHSRQLAAVTLQHAEVPPDLTEQAVVNFGTQAPPALLLDTRAEQPSAKLQHYTETFEGRILLVCESAGRREALLDLLRNIHIFPHGFDGWQAFLNSNEKLGITVGPLEQGLLLTSAAGVPISVITESQIFGERAHQRRRRKARQRDAEAIISSLSDLNIGAPVVHEEHGVGRYLGLQILDIGGTGTEFLVLEYADGDKLFVPVASLDLISRYTGASPEHAPLHKLGTDQWQRAKRKAARQIRDVAAELLDIYARRAARKGHAFKPNEREMLAFAAGFPFEETPDQQSAIEAVIEDMTNGKPMDRVICGDVGFGKTEVAMRATFTALQDSKQVAILVPTTLLAQQHFQNFRDRFADWPVHIESLSRFSSAAQQQKVIDDLATGKVDVVIGTHRLLQKGINFKDLGLVIIDEEHRFGVRHKEKLKALRADVDVLTLTATPIPRTLNMALSGLRDLSIIATPPARRNAIKTFVSEWRDNIILEACQRELKRGGQIYFVHNKVQNIHAIAEQITKIIPEARVAIAHGQLPERELESVMLDFYHQRYNLLICTTIIESGIDVPTANTIIINRADHFGLAQLHQLRGRVGRSHHRAYAYLLTPPPKTMTDDARKRLEAIESLEDLGAGFTLASHDLEIRGAGELLGEEQSGQIHEIGYSLYTEMLERAVKALKQGKEPMLDMPIRSGVEIDLGVPALLPQDYIFDVHTRLVLYKRIANASEQEELRELQVELIDRFGLLPEAAKHLFAIAELKLKIAGIGATKIKSNLEYGYIEFTDNPNIAPEKLIKLIQLQSRIYSFDGKKKLTFRHSCSRVQQQIDFIEHLLLAELVSNKAA